MSSVMMDMWHPLMVEKTMLCIMAILLNSDDVISDVISDDVISDDVISDITDDVIRIGHLICCNKSHPLHSFITIF